MHRAVGLTLVVVLILAAACTTGSAAVGSTPPTGGHVTARPSVPAPAEPAGADAWLVVGRAGETGIEVVRAGTHERMLELPAGLPGADWSRVVAAIPGALETRIVTYAAGAGWTPVERVIDGAWRLPMIGRDPVPVGGSLDGKSIVLVEDHPAEDGPTRFAILSAPLDGAPRVIELDGVFAYDALAPDGSTLFVIEHLDGRGNGRYQVRAVDVAAGTLREGIVADKRTLAAEMAGWPIGQVRRADGLVFTLYDGADHPFIHALNTVDATAVCIDLPHGHVRDARAMLDWGMADAGGTLYAVNASLGHIVEIDGTTLEVRRTAEIEPLRSAAVSLAKFGHVAAGPVNRRVVASPDGATLYAAGRGGIVVIDTAVLEQRDRFLAGLAVEAVGLMPDGATLYALLRDRGRIVGLDAATGKSLGELAGEGYDRLLGVVPW